MNEEEKLKMITGSAKSPLFLWPLSAEFVTVADHVVLPIWSLSFGHMTNYSVSIGIVTYIHYYNTLKFSFLLFYLHHHFPLDLFLATFLLSIAE